MPKLNVEVSITKDNFALFEACVTGMKAQYLMKDSVEKDNLHMQVSMSLAYLVNSMRKTVESREYIYRISVPREYFPEDNLRAVALNVRMNRAIEHICTMAVNQYKDEFEILKEKEDSTEFQEFSSRPTAMIGVIMVSLLDQFKQPVIDHN
ncbi:hypothetical protein JOC36_001455 [Weissella uvarum]|uniref:hypothetical protein n=1 Tax=Weissella uvarum TaxID=1479233 RepID=UPI0019616950|nr:hypothetical protein [Weissella uvarum]MBM7617862.1 hypothetical protein [Weissella uvarum]MCM0596139.1 hypothetical protein [Weissella uvarum]